EGANAAGGSAPVSDTNDSLRDTARPGGTDPDAGAALDPLTEKALDRRTLAASAPPGPALNAPTPRPGGDVDRPGDTFGEGAFASDGGAPISDTSDRLRDTARPGGTGPDAGAAPDPTTEKALDRRTWAAWLARILTKPPPAQDALFAEHLAHHLDLLTAIAAGPTGQADALWAGEAGQAAASLVEALEAAAAAGGAMSAGDYRRAITALLAARDVPAAAFAPDPRILIWGTIEARIGRADVTVLGGLNEGVWPKQPAPDPWLNATLRRTLGLPATERQIGLSAHDFQQAVSTGAVVLTRALRDESAPTVAARWMLRLENLLLGLGPEGASAWTAMRARGALWQARAAALDRPAAKIPPAPRPAPAPPAAARPRRLSATAVGTLIRDPYTIYARSILRLRPLDPLGRTADVRERGTALHAALEAFVHGTRDAWPSDPGPVFAETVATSLAASVPWPAARALWQARLMMLAPWFLEEEAKRRMWGRPCVLEAAGALDLPLSPPITLTARVDRIDVAPDGRLAIFDYKGTPPTAKEMAFFDKQLQVEALIAEAGGFPDCPAAPVTHAEMIGLGKDKKTEVLPDPTDAIAKVREKLPDLLATYQNPATPYLARSRPQRLTYASDYDHLSRFGEWEDGADAPVQRL
ncbi:MAG: PD-(D/E)XK nuclease family protein, partial [Pseudomonadota bacterium]